MKYIKIVDGEPVGSYFTYNAIKQIIAPSTAPKGKDIDLSYLNNETGQTVPGDYYALVETEAKPNTLDGVYTLDDLPVKENDQWVRKWSRRDYTNEELKQFAKAERKRREGGQVTVELADGTNITFNVDQDSKINLTIIMVNALFAKFVTNTDFSVAFSHTEGSKVIDKDDILTVCNTALSVKGQQSFNDLADIDDDIDAGVITTIQQVINKFNE